MFHARKLQFLRKLFTFSGIALDVVASADQFQVTNNAKMWGSSKRAKKGCVGVDFQDLTHMHQGYLFVYHKKQELEPEIKRVRVTTSSWSRRERQESRTRICCDQRKKRTNFDLLPKFANETPLPKDVFFSSKKETNINMPVLRRGQNQTEARPTNGRARRKNSRRTKSPRRIPCNF